jgi:hypothetical protein
VPIKQSQGKIRTRQYEEHTKVFAHVILMTCPHALNEAPWGDERKGRLLCVHLLCAVMAEPTTCAWQILIIREGKMFEGQGRKRKLVSEPWYTVRSMYSTLLFTTQSRVNVHNMKISTKTIWPIFTTRCLTTYHMHHTCQ